MRCLFVEFQHIQSSDSEHFPKEFQFRGSNASRVIEREGEDWEPNGSEKIERGWHNLNPIPGMNCDCFEMRWIVPFWGRPRRVEKERVGTQQSWCRANRRRGRGVVSLSRIMERLRHQPSTRELVSGNLRGLCVEQGIQVRWCRVSIGRRNGRTRSDRWSAPSYLSLQLSSKRA